MINTVIHSFIHAMKIAINLSPLSIERISRENLFNLFSTHIEYFQNTLMFFSARCIYSFEKIIMKKNDDRLKRSPSGNSNRRLYVSLNMLNRYFIAFNLATEEE